MLCLFSAIELVLPIFDRAKLFLLPADDVLPGILAGGTPVPAPVLLDGRAGNLGGSTSGTLNPGPGPAPTEDRLNSFL